MKARIALALTGFAVIALSAAARTPPGNGTEPEGTAIAEPRPDEPSPATDSSEASRNGECQADLCLHDGLFWIWGEVGDRHTTGEPLPGGKGGILYAWSDDNPELLVKVLDGCWFNRHWWVFVGSATDQPYTIVVKHIPSDISRVFESNSENPLLGLNETAAFAVCE